MALNYRSTNNLDLDFSFAYLNSILLHENSRLLLYDHMTRTMLDQHIGLTTIFKYQKNKNLCNINTVHKAKFFCSKKVGRGYTGVALTIGYSSA